MLNIIFNKITYEKMENIKFSISKSWRYDKKCVYLTIFMALISAIQPFIILILPRLIIDELTGYSRGNTLIALVVLNGLLTSTVYFLIAFMENRKDFLKIVYGLLREYAYVNLNTDYVNIENPNFLNKTTTARMTIYNIVNAVLPRLSSAFSSILIFVGYGIIIARLHFGIFIFLLLSSGIIYIYSNKAKKFQYLKQDEVSALDRRKQVISDIMSDYKYGKDIRVYNYSSFLVEKYNKSKLERFNILKEITNKYFNSSIVENAVIFFVEGISYLYLIYLVLSNNITIGGFTMYLGAILTFSVVVKNLVNDVVEINDKILYIKDLRMFLTFEKNKTVETFILPVPPYKIKFENVFFKYPNYDNKNTLDLKKNNHEYVISDLNLTIDCGQKLAIVGVNGAGKTTIVKLLCGLYKPCKGKITLNDINIQHIPREEYWKILSTIFQEIIIFAFSIAENITVCEKHQMNTELLNNVITKSNLKKKISLLENGVETSLYKFLDENGIELSLGEQQRLSMARALYKQGDIIILDEPTASLDPIAEHLMYKNFDEIIENKTAIYISHRLSSTRFCDKIAYIENGQVVEYGTHSQLIKLNGKYANMFNVQSQYYK